MLSTEKTSSTELLAGLCRSGSKGLDDQVGEARPIGGAEQVKHSLNGIWREFKKLQEENREQKKIIFELRQRIEELEEEKEFEDAE